MKWSSRGPACGQSLQFQLPAAFVFKFPRSGFALLVIGVLWLCNVVFPTVLCQLGLRCDLGVDSVVFAMRDVGCAMCDVGMRCGSLGLLGAMCIVFAQANQVTHNACLATC